MQYQRAAIEQQRLETMSTEKRVEGLYGEIKQLRGTTTHLNGETPLCRLCLTSALNNLYLSFKKLKMIVLPLSSETAKFLLWQIVIV